MSANSKALELAMELGFDAVAATPLAPPKRASEFQAWLDAGRHGSMDYLERQRERIADPKKVLPGAKSLLLVSLGHSRAPIQLEGGARVARYAAGRDYHNYLGKKLRKLGKRLLEAGLEGPVRGITDAGPILERSHGASAGLGSESKAGNLLSPTHGPWFFLGELLIGEELEPGPAQSESMPNCGTCTACLDVCPTEAIVAPGEVDARRCISYLTIENRGPIPREFRAPLGPWVFGCDLCSEVCPWGNKAPDHGERFGTHQVLEGTGPGSPLVEWLGSSEPFSETFNGSPLQRPKRDGLARNAAIVLGNLPSDEGRESLLKSLRLDDSPTVRLSAGWALAQGHGTDAGVREQLNNAVRREVDEDAKADLTESLDRL
jgi:epoxyqueuosine reductase